jgi:predicted unusual protein kinase regulating ubiquinone biosynthesis (AarF/ABC1/UbiB family)
VKSLMDLSNKTLSKFPFRLPKNLALYMRMTSIVEGIYHQHKIRFQFVKVLSNLFEQEGLINDAYIEEIKYSVQKFMKNIEASVNLSQTIKTYIDNQETNIKKTDKLYTFLGKSIFASALFVGSAFLFSYTPVISSIGFICSIILFVFSIIKK